MTELTAIASSEKPGGGPLWKKRDLDRRERYNRRLPVVSVPWALPADTPVLVIAREPHPPPDSVRLDVPGCQEEDRGHLEESCLGN